jgi:hypothetical protein
MKRLSIVEEQDNEGGSILLANDGKNNSNSLNNLLDDLED